MIRLELTLSDWFYNSILGKEVLTINRDYFRLGKPLERRLYEIARKHCGNQDSWSISLENLKEKTGSNSTLNKFRYFVKEIEKSDYLPDYTIQLSKDGLVTFTSIRTDVFEIPGLKRKTVEQGAKIVEEAGTGWDYYKLREEFTMSLMKGFKPDKVDGAFINFVKKKVANKI